MSQFGYIMVLLSIVLGLSITHMMLGLGRLLYRLAGHGPAVRLDWIHLTWAGFIFVWLVGFWWWEYSWRTVEDWGLLLYLFLVLYAVCLFLICVILFPHGADEVTDFRSYFMKVRVWFFGLLIFLTVIDVMEAVLKGTDYLARLGATYWTLSASQVVVSIIGLRTTNRILHGAMAVVLLIYALIQLLTTYPLLNY